MDIFRRLFGSRSPVVQFIGRRARARKVKALVESIRCTSYDERRLTALAALAPIADAQATEVLLDCLGSENISIRGWSVCAFKRVVDPRAVEPLLALLHGGDKTILPDIEEALSAQGEPALEGLCAALDEPNEDIVRHAAQAIYVIPGDKAFHALVAALAHKSDEVVLRTAQCLGFRGDPRAVEPLADLLLREDLGYSAADFVIQALFKFRVPAERVVLDRLADVSERIRGKVLRKLSERPSPEVVAVLERLAANDLSHGARAEAEGVLKVIASNPELIAARLIASGDSSHTMDFATFRKCVDDLPYCSQRTLCLIAAAEALMKAGRNLPALQCYIELVAADPLEGIENVSWNWINGAWHQTAGRVTRPGWIRIRSDDPSVAAAFQAATGYPRQKNRSDSPEAPSRASAALRAFLGRPGEKPSSKLQIENGG